jgi:hypothetical protein
VIQFVQQKVALRFTSNRGIALKAALTDEVQLPCLVIMQGNLSCTLFKAVKHQGTRVLGLSFVM